MLTIDIPGSGSLNLSYLVLDYNGTIAEDGELINGVADQLLSLSRNLAIHVLTADTHGTVQEKLGSLPCTLHVISPDNQEQSKYEYISGLECRYVAAIGNGRNDRLMLREAALGIGVIQSEGACVAAVNEADIICTSIHDALNLFVIPTRLQATLRE
jgi:soluble P-type ATPase